MSSRDDTPSQVGSEERGRFGEEKKRKKRDSSQLICSLTEVRSFGKMGIYLSCQAWSCMSEAGPFSALHVQVAIGVRIPCRILGTGVGTAPGLPGHRRPY